MGNPEIATGRNVVLAMIATLAPWWAAEALAVDRYRVELLVFRNSDSSAEAASVPELRDFRAAWDASVAAPPEAPVALAQAGTTFDSLASRLDRVGGYQPLLNLAWEQSAIEYQPAVRVHDAEVILKIPGQPAGEAEPSSAEAADDLLGDIGDDAPLANAPIAEQPVPIAIASFDGDASAEPLLLPLYRLDGTVQLLRSRFLHLDLDLEWRVDDRDDIDDLDDLDDGAAVPPPEPFRVHRLRQSRQVKPDTMIYFDSEVLGVMARITALEDSAPEAE